MKFMTLLTPPPQFLAASLLSSLQLGEPGVLGGVFTPPRQGSDKHLLTERNANRPKLLRRRTAQGGGWRVRVEVGGGCGLKKGKGEKGEDTLPPPFTSHKLPTREIDPEFSRIRQLLWQRTSRDEVQGRGDPLGYRCCGP